MKHQTHSTHGRTGLASHAAMVALTPARAVTSHVRRRYHERYFGKYRFFRFVFAFDMFLVGVAAALFLVDLMFLVRVFQPVDPGIQVTLHAPLLRASDTVPVEVTLRVTDAKPHEDVRLYWRLPAWVEILQAQPALEKQGSVFFGTMNPGHAYASRLLIRIKATPGTKLPFAFSLRQFGIFGFPRVDVGSEEHVVQTSALRVFLAVDVQRIVSHGSVPLMIVNDGSATATLLTLRLSAQDGARDARFSGGAQSLFIHELSPHERRVVFLDIGAPSAKNIRLAWELQDGAQIVDAREQTFFVVPDGRMRIVEPLRWVRGNVEAIVSIRNATQDARLFVFHPMLQTAAGPFQLFSLVPGDHQISIPFSMRVTTGTADEWSVIPIANFDGESVFGARTRGRLSSTFPFQAEVIYYTALGDQIGVGSLPPRAGEKTSFWVVWSVGPIDADLTQLSLQTVLPENVRASGKFASATRGTFQTDGKNVTWTISRLGATGGERETFAFEIELTPSLRDRGRNVSLLGESVAEAFDARSGERLEAFASGETTDLQHDAKGKGKGIIR